MDGIFGFTGIVLFIIGLIMLIVRFIKKTNKKTPMIILIIGIIFTAIGFSLSSSNETNDNNKQESSSSETKTTTSNSSNESLTQFEEFLETNNHDWGAFLDSYYSISPVTEQNTAFTKYISGKTFTFEGTVIETMTTRIAIIADKEYDDKSWSDISTTPKVSYVIFAKDVNNADTFTKGDKVTFTGEISSRGSNIEKSYAQWDMINSKVSKK
ncbi:DUF3221 domain-containing protein [Enterococcus faecium]|uniref:DUF3221 domain-containing protein n=1 Tax=Enterococcus faecium TaxID=1352 RepID=UPI0020C9001D|nr:DUF3221 domain-containing protein [Enterococcus faecium]